MSGRQSSIDRLPPDILERLQELLRDPRCTQLDATIRINAILADEGHPERVSKSAVNRYDLEMRKVGEKLRQSREIAEMWIGKMGAAPQGKIGNLINETLRSLAFDITLKLQDGELNGESLPGVIDQLKGMALAMQRLEASASLSVKREAEIRRQALEEATEVIKKTAGETDMSDEAVRLLDERIKRIYGA
jgi:hypothetical protein